MILSESETPTPSYTLRTRSLSRTLAVATSTDVRPAWGDLGRYWPLNYIAGPLVSSSDRARPYHLNLLSQMMAHCNLPRIHTGGGYLSKHPPDHAILHIHSCGLVYSEQSRPQLHGQLQSPIIQRPDRARFRAPLTLEIKAAPKNGP